MRVIVDLRKDEAETAVRKLEALGFVADEGHAAPKPHDRDPGLCRVAGEVPLQRLHDLQLTWGVVTWHIAEMAA